LKVEPYFFDQTAFLRYARGMQFLLPAGFMVFYIMVIGLFNFYTRVNAARTRQISIGYYKVFDDKKYTAPEFLVRLGRHYNNQFELPLLFLITCALSLQIQIEGGIGYTLAWAFVGTRLAHTYIHLGSNHVTIRALWFIAGWACIAGMWIVILGKAVNES
jgi:hypothetical protein